MEVNTGMTFSTTMTTVLEAEKQVLFGMNERFMVPLCDVRSRVLLDTPIPDQIPLPAIGSFRAFRSNVFWFSHSVAVPSDGIPPGDTVMFNGTIVKHPLLLVAFT